jgi:hypothetical protein
MTKDEIKNVFADVNEEMRTRGISISRMNMTLSGTSWCKFAEAFTERGLNAEPRSDGIIFDGGHLQATMVGADVQVQLVIHSNDEVVNDVGTYGEKYQFRAGRALMPIDHGGKGYPDAVACLEINEERLGITREGALRIIALLTKCVDSQE